MGKIESDDNDDVKAKYKSVEVFARPSTQLT